MRKIGIIALLSLMALALAAVPVMAASPHEVPKDPIECVLNNDGTVTCDGTVAGLGNVSRVTTNIDVPFGCATRGNMNQPRGHIQGTSGPLRVRNGRVTFSVTAGPAVCPNGLNPAVGDFATVTISDLDGNVLFAILAHQ